MTERTLTIEVDTPYDEDGDVSWLYQTPKQLGSLEAAVANRRRLLALERGEWHLIGVRLAATVTLTRSGLVDSELTLTSPGVWSVESDSDADHIRELAADDADYLREDLLALGFSVEEIGAALAEAGVSDAPADRLEYLRAELRAERLSWGELAELQSLAPHIAADDVELLEAAGVPEHEVR
jgi:hypothetical protein